MESSKGKSSLLELVLTKANAVRQSTQEAPLKSAETDDQHLLVLCEARFPHLAEFLFESVFRFAVYRIPLSITEYVLYQDTFGMETVYFYCPRCNITLERDYQAYCDRCGQRLNWKSIHAAKERHRTF